MRENLEMGGGLIFSQQVLLALIERGLGREEAYRIVQSAAAAAWDRGASFREEIAADPAVSRLLSRTELEALFEPRLEHLESVFARLEKLEVEA